MISMVRIHCTPSTARLATHCTTVTVFSARFGATAWPSWPSWPSWPRGKGLCLRWSCEARSTTFLATLREVKKCAKVLDKKDKKDKKVYRRVNGRDFQETLKKCQNIHHKCEEKPLQTTVDTPGNTAEWPHSRPAMGLKPVMFHSMNINGTSNVREWHVFQVSTMLVQGSLGQRWPRKWDKSQWECRCQASSSSFQPEGQEPHQTAEVVFCTSNPSLFVNWTRLNQCSMSSDS